MHTHAYHLHRSKPGKADLLHDAVMVGCDVRIRTEL